jgi:hypothetical protein
MFRGNQFALAYLGFENDSKSFSYFSQKSKFLEGTAPVSVVVHRKLWWILPP